MRLKLASLSVIKLILFSAVLPQQLNAMPITRVILSTNESPEYYKFWPIVAAVWEEFMGIPVTLFLIATEEFMFEHEDLFILQRHGEVIRLDPIPEMPTATQAQCIRLLGPAYYPEDYCIISDIDLIPLDKEWFPSITSLYPNDSFVTSTHSTEKKTRISMSFNAAKGTTWMEIFNINNLEQIPDKLLEFHFREFDWGPDELPGADELVLTEKVRAWGSRTNRFKEYKLDWGTRIQNPYDRKTRFSLNKLPIFVEPSRPASREEIEPILQSIGYTYHEWE